MRRFPKLPVRDLKGGFLTKPHHPDEVIIPDDVSYRRFPVRAGDDEGDLLLKYRRAQADTLLRLLKVKPADLKDALKTQSARRAISEHNKKMRAEQDQTA